jgi:dethiobiotin synthetase
MASGYFITGTDTGVGKTTTTIALIDYFKRQGKRVVGMKPVASGCVWRDGCLQNEDALLILQHANVAFPYEIINPYAYELPVSPHLAGAENPVRLEVIQACFKRLADDSDWVLVEGAGGWYSPITPAFDNADLAVMLGLPVVLVVPIRLGCINQGRLAMSAINRSEVVCAGWIAVCIEPNMPFEQENIAFLKDSLESPLLGIVPYQAGVHVESSGNFFP